MPPSQSANVRFAQLSSAARSLWPTMSSQPSTAARYRGRDKKRPATPNPDSPAEKINGAVSRAHSEAAAKIGSEWDYKIALAVVTLLGFWTRFWGITHPDQVVFDEVHFGKVRAGPLNGCHACSDGRLRSLPRTIFNAPTSSTSTLPSENSSSHLLAGSSATMARSSLRILAIHMSRTRFLMWPTGLCPLPWVRLRFPLSS